MAYIEEFALNYKHMEENLEDAIQITAIIGKHCNGKNVSMLNLSKLAGLFNISFT